MAYRDFTFPEVQQTLRLNLREADLHSHIAPRAVSAEFTERMRVGIELALSVNTEKARSEFIIAPVLLELLRELHGSFGLFSGIEFNVDPEQGLNGFCDFILTRTPLQSVLTAPLVAIVEAKNDNLRTGLGQCIAAMVAAREFNARAGNSIETIYGVVTTGSSWRFLQLSGSQLTLDRREYFAAELGHLLAILASIVSPPTASPIH